MRSPVDSSRRLDCWDTMCIHSHRTWRARSRTSVRRDSTPHRLRWSWIPRLSGMCSRSRSSCRGDRWTCRRRSPLDTGSLASRRGANPAVVASRSATSSRARVYCARGRVDRHSLSLSSSSTSSYLPNLSLHGRPSSSSRAPPLAAQPRSPNIPDRTSLLHRHSASAHLSENFSAVSAGHQCLV